jgi:hypothetical protein
MWRGDRGASCTPSGKGQRGVVAVYLIKVPGEAERRRDRRCSIRARGTSVWLNTRTTPSAAPY